MDSSGGDSVEWSEVLTWRCNDDDGGAKASVLGARWERARVRIMKLRELIAIMVTRRVRSECRLGISTISTSAWELMMMMLKERILW